MQQLLCEVASGDGRVDLAQFADIIEHWLAAG
jgi:hypothetical protein